MGLLNLFAKPAPPLRRLPRGSFTVDRGGSVLTGTLPSAFPAQLVQTVAQQVLTAFRDATTAQVPLSELIINYGSLKVTARELRGGAIVFLAPKTPGTPDHRS